MLKTFARPAVILLVFLAAIAASAQRLAVGDGAGVTIIDVGTGKATDAITLHDSADRLLATRDGARIVSISRGAGTTNWLGRFRPTSIASATVIDGSAMKELQRVELGWNVSDAQITSNEKTLVVLSPGVDGNGADFKPASLYAINLATGALIGKTVFERTSKGALLTADQKQAMVYFEGEPNVRPTLLRFVELAGMQNVGEVTFDAKTKTPAAFEGHDLVYLLDPPQARAGTLYVVSASQRKLLGSYPVGEIASIGAFDEATGRLFVISQSTERGERGFNGRLDVFHNGAPETSQKTTDIPAKMIIAPDRKLALITGARGLDFVPLDTLKPEEPIRGAHAHEIYFSPDQKRAFLYFASEKHCCSVAVYDVPGRKLMTSFMIGSKGMRIGQALLAVGATAASFSSAHSAARAAGASSFYYSVYTPRVANAARGMMIIRQDGRFAYAVDPQTNRLTVIDGESGERLNNVAVGGDAHEVVALRDTGTIAVLGGKSVTFIDTKANDKSGEATFAGDLHGFDVTADGSRGVAIAEGKVAIFDATGKPLSEVAVSHPKGWLLLP